jgi:glycosyltransferase involved in cell wall biosynthesis
MEKPLNILVLDDGRSVHGERYVAALRERGMAVWVASLEPGDMVDIPLKGRLGITGLDYVFIAGQLSEIVKKHGIDIVDAHSASGYGFSAAVSRVWKTAPLVLHCLGSDILISAPKSVIHMARVRTAVGRAGVVFSDSEYMSSKIREIDPDANIKIKYWGAERAVFDVYHRKSEWNFVNQAVIDVLVPRPQEEVYNNELIVEALFDFVSEHRITLTFPNRGTRLEGFESLVRSKFNGGQVRFYDRLPRPAYPEFLSGFDVYLSASTSDSSPASLIEAMAAGLFPIVGNIDGVKEWMDDKSGLMFDITSAASLTQAFEKLLSGQIEIEKIIQNNREKAERRGRFEEGIETTIKVMQELHHA